MRKVMIAALIAGQLFTGAVPVVAQGYAPVRETETGAFGGVRLRIPFGGPAREPVRAQGRTGPDGRKLGVSTLGWIAIGVGVAAVIVVSAAAICFSDSDCVGSE